MGERFQGAKWPGFSQANPSRSPVCMRMTKVKYENCHIRFITLTWTCRSLGLVPMARLEFRKCQG